MCVLVYLLPVHRTRGKDRDDDDDDDASVTRVRHTPREIPRFTPGRVHMYYFGITRTLRRRRRLCRGAAPRICYYYFFIISPPPVPSRPVVVSLPGRLARKRAGYARRAGSRDKRLVAGTQTGRVVAVRSHRYVYKIYNERADACLTRAISFISPSCCTVAGYDRFIFIVFFCIPVIIIKVYILGARVQAERVDFFFFFRHANDRSGGPTLLGRGLLAHFSSSELPILRVGAVVG